MKTRPKLTVERTFKASIDDVWELWTTRDGMEAWMGPDGFNVTVTELDLRPGGWLGYTMTTVGPEQEAETWAPARSEKPKRARSR